MHICTIFNFVSRFTMPCIKQKMFEVHLERLHYLALFTHNLSLVFAMNFETIYTHLCNPWEIHGWTSSGMIYWWPDSCWLIYCMEFTLLSKTHTDQQKICMYIIYNPFCEWNYQKWTCFIQQTKIGIKAKI